MTDFPEGGNSNQLKNNIKRNLTLNLKKNASLQPILSSPDLKMLQVNTPELDSMLLLNHMPNNLPSNLTPTLLFTKSATAEQETFTQGFVEALSNLHNSNSQQGSDSNASSVFNDSFLPNIKEEPQTVPNMNSPPMSPVNMEEQERIKLERKRHRNRLAASKCRTRKLERISKLEDKVKQLKCENSDLSNIVVQLRENVGLLKLEVLEHNKAGCPIINSYA